VLFNIHKANRHFNYDDLAQLPLLNINHSIMFINIIIIY